MRVLYVYPFCNIGGVSTVIRRRMQTVHADDSVSCLFKSAAQSGERELISSGVSKVNVGGAQALTLIADEEYCINFDLIFIIDWPEALFNLCDHYEGAVIYEFHSSLPTVIESLSLLPVNKINKVLVPSEWSKKIFIAETHVKQEDVCVVSNFIGREFLSGAADKAAFSCKKNTCLSIGKMHASKNWQECLRIVSMLKKKGVEIPLIFVSGGHLDQGYVSNFFSVASQLGIRSQIDWFHNLSQMQMGNLMKSVAENEGFLLSSSLYESFGFTLLEANTIGLPVLAADVCAVSEVIEDNVYGLLYDAGDIKAASMKIEELTSDSAMRESLIASAHANQDRFSEEKSTSTMTEVIKNIDCDSRIDNQNATVIEGELVSFITDSHEAEKITT